MRLQNWKRNRRGAALVEAVIIVTAFVTLVLGMLDLGIGVFHRHILSQAARQGARAAIVHGSRSLAPWGPSQYGPVAANSGGPQAQAIALYLAGIDPRTVNVTYQWIDGSNKTENRVQVTVTSTWTPIVQSIFGNKPVSLSASSTMQIAH